VSNTSSFTRVFTAISIGVAINLLAFIATYKVAKRYRYSKSSIIDREARKAYISRKKMTIASMHIRKIRSNIFKLSLYQFMIPFTAYIGSIAIYMATSFLFFKEYIEYIPLKSTCIAPIPIQIPVKESDYGCIVSVVWIYFLVFLMFLPIYDHYIKKVLQM